MSDFHSNEGPRWKNHISPPTSTVSRGERLLNHTFDTWRNEFRGILEDYRREIQTRLSIIEHEIEKKSDKETVDLLMRAVQEDLHRQAGDIKTLSTGLTGKMGVETMWKVIGLVLTLSGPAGGIVGFVIHFLARG